MIKQPLRQEKCLADLLRRPEVSYRLITTLPNAGPGCDDKEVAQQLEIESRYSGYIERQQQEIERQQRNEGLPISGDVDFTQIRGLSTEAMEILQQHRPETLGQARRISGITPAVISLLLVHFKKHRALRTAA